MSELEIKTMRRQQFILGWLCIALPFASILFGFFGIRTNVNYPDWWYSISATFYANSNIIMIGLLFTTAIYFWAYKGYDKVDDIATKLCAISAFGIISFPTFTTYESYVGIFSLPSNISHIFHCIFAFVFYLGFVFMIFRFRKSSGTMTDKKKLRNKFYLVFGIINIINIVFIVLRILLKLPDYFVIIFETVLQICCGFSWLIKSEAFKFLND